MSVRYSWQSAIFLKSVRMTTHPTSLVTHARDNWWTLGFANAFVSPGVNSRGELVPSHGTSRRRLGDKNYSWVYLHFRHVFSDAILISNFTISELFAPLHSDLPLWTNWVVLQLLFIVFVTSIISLVEVTFAIKHQSRSRLRAVLSFHGV
jgi:hypothetical protein